MIILFLKGCWKFLLIVIIQFEKLVLNIKNKNIIIINDETSESLKHIISYNQVQLLQQTYH